MAVGGASLPGRYAARAPDERVSYTLRAPEKRHRSGVNALALGPDNLYTAGRDGVVRAWRLPQPYPGEPLRERPEAHASFDEHVDWVNAALLVHREERLITASSDTTVKVWNTADPRESLRTLIEHTDYVKALSALADGAVVSGSLDGRILIWDLVTGTVRHECAGGDPAIHPASSTRPSVYCLASSARDLQANVIVSGSTDRTIAVYDARSGGNVVRLRGHADAIRCLAIKYDATQLLSGSSDSTVRLWDLRQQRCVRTFDSHPSDSVWALDTDREFQTFVSGGRDGTVWHSTIDGDNASLVVAVADVEKRSNMILDVALVPDERLVWVSTTGSTVRLWALPPSKVQNNHIPANGRRQDEDAEVEVSAMHQSDVDTMHHTFGGTRGPLVELPGLPAIVAHKIMNNRRHVMTCDTSDELVIWDITRGVRLRSLGLKPDRDLDQIAEDYDETVAVPSWFQVDIRLGSVSVRLDRTSVSNAEVYAIDADLDVESEDIKVNIGEHVVRGLFATWLSRLALPGASQGSGNGSPSVGRTSAGGSQGDRTVSPHTTSPGTPQRPPLPPYRFAQNIPVVVTEESPVPILQRMTGKFSGDAETPYLPPWVVDIVRDGKTQAREVPKIGFTLFPVDGSRLPELSTVNLSAPRVLRVRKVATYVAKELNQIIGEDALQEDIQADDLDIICHGKPLPPTMSLATARQFKWRSPDDLQLTFRLRPMDANSVHEGGAGVPRA
jgi:WD repeat-containing protein 48